MNVLLKEVINEHKEENETYSSVQKIILNCI